MIETTRAVAPDFTISDEVNRLRLVLLRLARSIRSNAISDITQSQAAVMATLGRHGPSTIGQIAAYEHVQPPSASKIVAGLEALGMAVRHSDPDDRRLALIALSAEGEAFMAAARAAGTSWLASRVAELDDDDRAALGDALPALEQLLRGTD
jgi:DNA-binding MarR family transcriptional regulator